MKFNAISRSLVAVALVATATGCNIYKKFEMPQSDALLGEYVEACEQEVDTTTFGNLQWQEVFTDPVLVDYINRALQNNTNLANAKLNIDIAHANMRGARLSYLPSLSIGAQGGASSIDNSKLSGWNYTIPLTASWEVDIFGKILNNKRSAEASYRQAEDYAQAVRSQIIGGVANCYYSIATLEAQLRLNRETAEIWRENVEVMKNYKLAGRTNEPAV
ncbi:MAG: TolC family protein, partial [Muribaculaceae bacterium]|nr:TolC family protein [Muribaculaceae bacterium]